MKRDKTALSIWEGNIDTALKGLKKDDKKCLKF